MANKKIITEEYLEKSYKGMLTEIKANMILFGPDDE